MRASGTSKYHAKSQYLIGLIRNAPLDKQRSDVIMGAVK
jgi:hypothetical protein